MNMSLEIIIVGGKYIEQKYDFNDYSFSSGVLYLIGRCCRRS